MAPSPSQKRGGTTCITGVLQWMGTSSSGETGEAEEVERWLFVIGRLWTPWKLRLMMIKLVPMGKNQGKANKGDILVGICYRAPNQDEEVDVVFYKKLENIPTPPAFGLVKDFNLVDICWEHNTAEKRHSRRFLECMEDNFLSQLVSKPTRGGTVLDLFTNRDGLVGDVGVGGCLGQSDHKTIEFSILGEARRGINKTYTLAFQRADFGLFKDLFRQFLGKQPLKTKESRKDGCASKPKT
ncbi:hypothetical protein DUI87_11065 [Hirundo rustica rustica]|uniref:Endonuclease/exonuclease/phosphatase domain-containing protein n=1 Tax=Hirundo rustica rustica TaxID=333673 RepID=A0A3M0KFL6_HIRRU|nr:hypothetical protein DUI87_11065 [Hirundo rustica rustica]